jgi:hypothetical protein
VLPTVGRIRVKDVRVRPTIGAVGIDYYMSNNCGIEVAGGMHINAEVDLEPAARSKPAYFGVLALLQQLNIHRRRTPAIAPGSPNLHWDCVNSKAPWELDEHYPYNNHTVPCAAGLNKIDLADAPGVLVEPPAFETVEVEPLDRFQTFLIWEVTDNNQTVTRANVAKPHVLARVDWQWHGTAQNTAGAPGACTSKTKPPLNIWGLKGPFEAKVTAVVIGKAAGTPIFPGGKGAPPLATPGAWVRCP